ncbi:MAG TPA: glycosyltransferase family 1 protein, partial [Patescibacteria group bacterium]|nr:glycosyltransferase family 1 protein [Patescibacteria group bacterium]
MLNCSDGEKAGVGHYTTSLVQELVRHYTEERFVLFIDHKTATIPEMSEFKKHAHVELVEFPLSTYKKYLPYVYAHPLVSHWINRKKLDVFHSPAYTIPLQYKQPSVVTVHDLVIYSHPEWFPKQPKFSQEKLVPASIKKAARVIAVSQSTAAAAKELFQLSEERVQVIYEGCTTQKRVSVVKAAAVREKFGITGRFLFFIGTIEPRKNLERLIAAFDQLVLQHAPRLASVQLVIAGAKGWKYEGIMNAATKAKAQKQIRFIGYVTHEEKIALMQSCHFFAFPSLWEGFGLPVLEAMGLGVPVLTSRIAAIPEVAGEACEYVDPENLVSILRGMDRLMEDPTYRQHLAEA